MVDKMSLVLTGAFVIAQAIMIANNHIPFDWIFIAFALLLDVFLGS